MTVRFVACEQNLWHVFDDNDINYLNYIGSVTVVGDGRWRAFATRLNLDYQPVPTESPDFPTRDEAGDWLLAGVGADS